MNPHANGSLALLCMRLGTVPYSASRKGAGVTSRLSGGIELQRRTMDELTERALYAPQLHRRIWFRVTASHLSKGVADATLLVHTVQSSWWELGRACVLGLRDSVLKNAQARHPARFSQMLWDWRSLISQS